MDSIALVTQQQQGQCPERGDLFLSVESAFKAPPASLRNRRRGIEIAKSVELERNDGQGANVNIRVAARTIHFRVQNNPYVRLCCIHNNKQNICVSDKSKSWPDFKTIELPAMNCFFFFLKRHSNVTIYNVMHHGCGALAYELNSQSIRRMAPIVEFSFLGCVLLYQPTFSISIND